MGTVTRRLEPFKPGAKSESQRRSREDRLRTLGYDEPSDAQRKKILNQNMAMRDWPKR